MELTQTEHGETVAPCERGAHNFIPIGDSQKRSDAAKIIIGTMSFCTRCSNSVFVEVASKSKFTEPSAVTPQGLLTRP